MMEFRKGINIGDHFEMGKVVRPYVSPVRDWYFEEVRSLGFDHVRLPARWSVHTDDENGYRIHEDFMDAVTQAVDGFLNAGLYVILNTHHFTGAVTDPEPYKEKLFAIWQQVAEHFRDYPDRLVFEVMNEPQNEVDPGVWNRIQNEAVAVIRRSNPTRQVMLGGVYWNDFSGLVLVEPPAGDQNLIGTFHYYHPQPFTHQGARWSPENYGYHDVQWLGTEEERAVVREHMAQARAWSEKHGLPVNLGEFGAYSTGDMASRARWTEHVRRTAEENGFSWSYWEFNHGFGIMNMPERTLNQPLVDALLKN